MNIKSGYHVAIRDCQAEVKMDPHSVINKTEVERVTLPIYGLTCWGGGSLTVERVILKVEGVRNAYVNPATEMAYVEYDPSRCSPEHLTAAIEQSGFHAGAPMHR
jgi:copper chaperone CopZ